MLLWLRALRRGLKDSQRGWTAEQHRHARIVQVGMSVILVVGFAVLVANPWSDRMTFLVVFGGIALASLLFIVAFVVWRERQ